MTEIFYRLYSQTNGSFYQLEKAERIKLIEVTIVNALKLELDDIQLRIMSKAQAILKEFKSLNFSKSNFSPSIERRKSLAKECFDVQTDIFQFVENKLKGIEYRSISNEEFTILIKSDLTNYLLISLFLSECRGKLLEFLLWQKKP